MSSVRIELTGIEFQPAAATTPRCLTTRVNDRAMPSTTWTPGAGANGLAYVARQWQGSPDRADIAITLQLDAAAETEIWIAARPTANSSLVLGALLPVRLPVAGGSSAVTIPVTLTGVKLGTAAIARHLIQWQWVTCDAGGAHATVFAATDHFVYITLDEPVFPWSATPGPGADYPWIEALDRACRWAAGERTPPGVFERITRAIDALGGAAVNTNGRATRFTYSDRPYFVSPPMGMWFFGLREFLSLLSGATNTADARANCADLAAAIAIFTNLLGCPLELRQLRSGSRRNFQLNMVRVFGLNERDSQRHTVNGFDFHRTAATKMATADAMFDACVQLDFRGVPGKPPFCWQPSIGTVFDSNAVINYVERLVEPGARSTLQSTAVPVPRIRLGSKGDVDSWISERFDVYRSRIAASISAQKGRSVFPDALAGVVLVDEQAWESDKHGARPSRRLASVGQSPEVLLSLREIVCDGLDQTLDVAAEILASAACEFSAPPPSESPFYMTNPAATEAVFILEGRVVLISSTGAERVDAAAFGAGLIARR